MKTVTAEMGPCAGHGHLALSYCDLEDRSEDSMLQVSLTATELMTFGFHAILTGIRVWARR